MMLFRLFFFFLKAANELFSMIYSSPVEQFKNIITFVFNTTLLFKILLHHITNVNRKKTLNLLCIFILCVTKNKIRDSSIQLENNQYVWSL